MPEQENYCIPFNQIQVQVILVAWHVPIGKAPAVAKRGRRSLLIPYHVHDLLLPGGTSGRDGPSFTEYLGPSYKCPSHGCPTEYMHQESGPAQTGLGFCGSNLEVLVDDGK